MSDSEGADGWGGDDDGPRSPWDLAESLAAIGVTGAWMAALFLGFEHWLVVLLVGYIVVVPVISEIGDYVENTADSVDVDEPDDPVERVRQQYVDGEIDEAEFESRLDDLLSDGPSTAPGETSNDGRREREREREEAGR